MPSIFSAISRGAATCASSRPSSSGSSSSDSLKSSVNQARRQKVIEALAATKGNKSGAARLLGVDRRTVYNMIKELGIEDA